MNRSYLLSLKLRSALAIVLGVMALILGAFWSGDAGLSWAAPNQNPHLQTVPTREPDDPTPEPSDPTPESPDPTLPPDEGGDDDDDDHSPPPPPPPEEGDDELLPSPLGEDEEPPTPTPGILAPVETPELVRTTAPIQSEDKLVGIDIYLPIIAHHAAPGVAAAGDSTFRAASPLPTPTTTTFTSPIPSPSPTPAAPSIERAAEPTASPTVAPTATVSAGQLPEAALPVEQRAGSLLWLYALGLGVILILGGVVLVNRS